MKTWKELTSMLCEATGKNTHMTHIEDRVIYGGVNGARSAILALRSLRDMLAGHSTGSEVDVTIKWDGAPAVFAGIDPGDGKFFVAKKGIFNKNPKVYKSVKEVQADTSGDLAKKLTIAFEELSKLGIKKGVLQGDLMFTRGDLELQTIDGEKLVTFHPNTIVYAFPVNSDAGRAILKAKLGIVWHTLYQGPTFEKMTAGYAVDMKSLKTSSTIWQIDASLEPKNLSGKGSLTADETAEVTLALAKAGTIFQQISSSTLAQIEANPSFAQSIEQFNNTLVRAGEKIKNPHKHVNNLIAWAAAKHDKEIDSRSSEKGKESAQQKKDAYMEFFSSHNKENLARMYELQNAIVDAKELIIRKLDALKSVKTFVKTKNGFKVTGQEGFVAIDHLEGNAYKLVDRLEFSSNNFSPDIIKGWDK